LTGDDSKDYETETSVLSELSSRGTPIGQTVLEASQRQDVVTAFLLPNSTRPKSVVYRLKNGTALRASIPELGK
ncbi:MAG: hypothetical protein ABIK62_02495, partial [candidate division WOR-3 bacterium]